MSKIPRDFNPNNDPLRENVIKFGIALSGDDTTLFHKEWIQEKLYSILKGTAHWSKSVDHAYMYGVGEESRDLFKATLD